MGRDSERRAGWEGDRYAAAAEHHRTFDDWFLGQHPPGPADRVVDAGSGSGEFTARLATLVTDGHVIGVEPDTSMLAAARRHEVDNLEFRQGSLTGLPEVCGRSWADLVVSRAVFHWIPIAEYPDAYAAVFDTLRPGGWFHAESGGAGNVRGVAELLDAVAWERGREPTSVTFPDAGVALELLEQVGFEIPPGAVTTVAQRRAFDRDGLLGFIRTQAALASGLTPDDDGFEPFVAAVTERVDELRRHDSSYDQTFVRLHVHCRRPV